MAWARLYPPPSKSSAFWDVESGELKYPFPVFMFKRQALNKDEKKLLFSFLVFKTSRGVMPLPVTYHITNNTHIDDSLMLTKVFRVKCQFGNGRN